MTNNILKIISILQLWIVGWNLQAQSLDSLALIDAKYDSILRSDSEEMNTLFYKHQNDVLINNLGPFGSPYYSPTAFYIQQKNHGRKRLPKKCS